MADLALKAGLRLEHLRRLFVDDEGACDERTDLSLRSTRHVIEASRSAGVRRRRGVGRKTANATRGRPHAVAQLPEDVGEMLSVRLQEVQEGVGSRRARVSPSGGGKRRRQTVSREALFALPSAEINAEKGV